MQVIIYSVMMFTVSSASDLAIYVYDTSNSNRRHNVDKKPTAGSKPEPVPLFKFEYCERDMLNMIINLVNEPQHVNTTVYLKTDFKPEKKITTCDNKKRSRSCKISHVLNKEPIIHLEFSSKTGFCPNRTIVQGQRVRKSQTERNNTPFPDMCLTSEPCLVKVDLANIDCRNEDPANRKPPEHIYPTSTQKNGENDERNSEEQKSSNKLLNIILSVVGVGLIIMVIFFFIKKYCVSQPVESTELNTYATTNEVLYADLSLAQGDTEPPRREEESPYAQIIGVMRPDDGNLKN